MSMLVTSFAIAGAAIGGYFGMMRAIAPSGRGELGPVLSVAAGAALGMVILGGSVAALSEAFSSSAQPSDIEKCAAAAPQGSAIKFTRNGDGSSTCTYEMK